jgi:ceramide glucosyltransferase
LWQYGIAANLSPAAVLRSTALSVLNTFLTILAFLSFALTLWRWAASMRFPLHRRTVVQTSLAGVTVLKPLKGCDAETKRCLRSWLIQKYPGPVQLLFGVASIADPVCAVVRELLAEFPGADAQLILCSQNLGANAKVSKLLQLEPLIRHPLVVISDADVAAPPDLLVNLTPHFDDPGVGLVNCFYRLANPQTLAMRWEAVSINADFWTQVLQAKSLGKVDFALGAVMALSAAQLTDIGGFATLADFLADDYQLGNHVWRQGKRIEFATVVVDCWDAPMGWAAVWRHQLRWARTMRVCKPALYFFTILENATLWPFLWLLWGATSRSLLSIKRFHLAPSDYYTFTLPIALPAGILFLIVRIVTALQQQLRLTQATTHFAYWWLPLIKDLLNVGIWGAAFWGNEIEWRGERYQIQPDGKLQRIPRQEASRIQT